MAILHEIADVNNGNSIDLMAVKCVSMEYDQSYREKHFKYI